MQVCLAPEEQMARLVVWEPPERQGNQDHKGQGVPTAMLALKDQQGLLGLQGSLVW